MHFVRLAAIAAVTCAVSACPRAHGPATEEGPVAQAAAAPTPQSVVRGRAFYLERIKIPPGADFTAQLVDNRLADTPAAVIASTTLEDVAGPPYDFTLAYDPAKVRADGDYGINATLRGVEGDLLFVTDTRVPVKLGSDAVVEFRMVRARAAGEPAPVPARIERSQWTCGEVTFEAVFDLDGERVDLKLPDDTLSLPLAVSASGARYADHRKNEFWTKGDTGTLSRDGGNPVECVRADAPPAAGSPWDKAKQRGIAFRGVGNEPGWFVEVGRGETPTLHAELDYGERKVDAQVQSLSGLLGYAGKTADGTRVRLVLEREPCSDGMSDTRYPVDAKLEVGDKTYAGCGRFLDD